MMGGTEDKGCEHLHALTRIKTLYHRVAKRREVARHETWSLVEVEGERKILFEARNGTRCEVTAPAERRLMTVREALREPREIARHIWLSLED